MLTLAAARRLLSVPRDATGMAPLAAALGFSEPAPFDAATRDALGIGGGAEPCLVARGPGALRALLIVLPDGVPARESVRRIASRMASRTPHLLWLLLGVGRSPALVTIAAWSAHRRGQRIAALLADRNPPADSDAETLRLLVASSGDDALTHARWLEILGRESLTRRFFRALERVVHTLGDAGTGAAPAARREAALLYVSRLLFLSFLEARGWLDGNPAFLSHGFDACVAANGDYQRRVLAPLFFGTLNTAPERRAARARAFGRLPFLNGGLFSRTTLERRRDIRFPDAALGLVFGDLLGRYRFVGREADEGWTESIVDPEMLGRAFESLMASDERRRSGAFFTPQPLVEAVTTAALADALAPCCDAGALSAALSGERMDSATATGIRARLATLRVLDPACGSGAFLVHALERLAALANAAGDSRHVSVVRREMLTRSIFGVDVNPTAVWLCELRLWLAVVIDDPAEDPLRVPALPNLDRHVRVGDALAGTGELEALAGKGGTALARLRARYVRASGPRKRSLARALDAAERQRALGLYDAAIARATCERRELLLAARSSDLFGGRRGSPGTEGARLATLRATVRELRCTRLRLRRGGALPFAFATHFADVADEGGFDLVIGNPPWVRPHHVAAGTRLALRREFAVARARRWRPVALPETAHAGFAMQVDLAAAFVERSLDLLRPGATLALLLPVKLWQSLAGSGVRRLLAERAELREVADWSRSPHAFDAAVYPSLLVARRRAARDGDVAIVAVSSERRGGTLVWRIQPGELTVDAAPGSPWLLAPPDVVAAFRRLTAAGVPLASRFGEPLLGVKCGCNEAFVVRRLADDGALSRIATSDREGWIESALLRPALRGDGVAPFATRGSEWIVWTHDDAGAPLARLPPHAARWLGAERHRLVARTDARRRARWWSLFRIDGARIGVPRVVWSDIGHTPRAAVLHAAEATVPLNSCYVLRVPDETDAHALTALLASPLAAAWLALVAEPARGGYHRYLGWTMSLLPLPRDWDRARALLAPLGARGAAGEVPETAELLHASLSAYRIRGCDVAALLAWNAS